MTASMAACSGSGEDGEVVLVEHPPESSEGDDSGDEKPASGEEQPDDPEQPPQSSSGEDEPTDGEPGGLVVGDDSCTSDSDCVPAKCCHASACVAKANAPDCKGVMCTQECQYGTLDCGGRCLCHEGRCAAKLSEAPESMKPTSPQ
jgi:hypothetical protein